MTDRPIIFSAPMVRALLDGRKTMTRRLAHQPVRVVFANNETEAADPVMVARVWRKVEPGDRLWVRESIRFINRDCEGLVCIGYPADGADLPIRVSPAEYDKTEGWWIRRSRPSIHMPRWASRLTLTVTAVKIERLQDITAADAEAEGVFRHTAKHLIDAVYGRERGNTAIQYFRELWDHLHGRGAWEANPEVVAISFTVAHGNIDA